MKIATALILAALAVPAHSAQPLSPTEYRGELRLQLDEARGRRDEEAINEIMRELRALDRAELRPRIIAPVAPGAPQTGRKISI